jgi:hypothetical protein
MPRAPPDLDAQLVERPDILSPKTGGAVTSQGLAWVLEKAEDQYGLP